MHASGWARALLAFVVMTPGCGEELAPIELPECDDDAIDWPLALMGVVELPGASFEVACGSGWGHGVETRDASELIELPNAFQDILPHPQGGLLLRAYGRESLWSDRLGVDVATESLIWLDEGATQVHWQLDDLSYGATFVVTNASATELWAWGHDDLLAYLSRIDPSTGEVLERVEWSGEMPMGGAAAWPQQGGMWLLVRDGFDAQVWHFSLRRMSSFAMQGESVRTLDSPVISFADGSQGVYVPSIEPVPEGGTLWGTVSPVEFVAEDGSSNWTLDEPHSFRVVDAQGGFLLANVDDGDADDHRSALALQRRSLDDASLLWERVHHRWEFVHAPSITEYLNDISWSYAARADGGYLIAGGHSYPAASCPQQPIVWAIDIDGEVEWAHRAEVCGDFFIPSSQVAARALVLGFSEAYGDTSNTGTRARWVQYFDL